MSSKNPFLEEEAALSDDSDVDSSEDEGEDDNDALVKEGAGFIADEDDSEEDEEEAPQRKKKKRHKRARERSMELDDEDINLVEENTVRALLCVDCLHWQCPSCLFSGSCRPVCPSVVRLVSRG